MSDFPTVLVTGAGGAAGVAVILALRNTTRVVAADADPTAVGLRLAHDAGVIPRSVQDEFVQEVEDLALRSNAKVLVCTVAEEIVPLVRDSKVLLDAGIATWLPSADAVAMCIDKWRFATRCLQVGIPIPVTALGTTEGVEPPWVIKPRFGRGSRDVFVIQEQDEAAWILHRVPEPIVQARLGGTEFTADVLVDRDGDVAGIVPRWRLETKAGISTKGRTFWHEGLVSDVRRLLACIGLQGPANIQGFITSDGQVSFTEVNPRFSGGLPLSIAAGADFIGEYIRGVLGHSIRRNRLKARTGVTMGRYFAEVFEE